MLTAACLTALALKILDEWFEAMEAGEARYPRWMARTGPGLLVYAFLSLAAAAIFDARLAAGYTFAAYAVGMHGRLRERQLSGVPGWVESLVSLAILVVACSLRLAIGFLAATIAAQLVDDVLDRTEDQGELVPSLANRFGTTECLLAALGLALLAWWAYPWLPVWTALAYAGVYALEHGPPQRKTGGGAGPC
ncbi:MAG: hypothetical protein AB1331_01600 [Bacillota bacterium]